MKFSKTEFEGLFIIETETYEDSRGSFFRTYCKKEFQKIGFAKEFVQMNQSINKKKRTFRGLHYQLGAHADTKLIRCIAGEVHDIVVDMRKDSKTFLQHFEIRLSEQNKKMLLVPEGFAHGFLTLEDNCQLVYQHTSYYTPGFEGFLNYKDPLLKVKLPGPVSVISDRDDTTPFLNMDELNGY